MTPGSGDLVLSNTCPVTTNATFVYQVYIETIENQKETRFITLNFDEVKEKIVSGEVVVPDDKESFEAKYGDVYQLD